jgi:hypothetical protein
MVQRKPRPTVAVKRPVEALPAPANDRANDRASDRAEFSLADLARGIAAREIRPRVADIRRLAEAVLAAEEKRARKKTGGKKQGKKRKLAKIPGQKAKR